MFENDVKEFEFDGVTYPYKCTMVALEKIQKFVGDLWFAENKLRGFRPHVDKDGVIDKTKGIQTLPDIELVAKSLCWMIEEGIDITQSKIEPLTEFELKRKWRENYSLTELAIIVYVEFELAVAGKKTIKTDGDEKEQTKSTATERQTKKR